ncbi:cytochrome P450 [Candidatus Poriferisocius sp.]|uniref:cytochrome P450 n=1 Tax=Candidatus Poriferisocius sp. TaxID=3101276 RepID=UPI003B01C77E
MKLSEVNLLDPDRFVRQEHHEMFKVLREQAPVMLHQDPNGTAFWNVVKHADLVDVNRDTEAFSSETGGISIPDPDSPNRNSEMDTRGVMMLTTDPPKHTRYRRLVSKGFTPRMIGLIEKYLRHRAILIVDNVIERGEADFVVDLASELPLQAIAEIMGVPQEDRMMLFEWSNRLIGIDDPEYNADKSDGSAAAMELYAYTNRLAKDRAANPRDDIVTKLINAEIDGDRLSELEFDMFMLLLTVAGNETTRNATAHGMLALMDHPEQFEMVRNSPDGVTDTHIDEILRWATPVLHFRRTATRDAEIRGRHIDSGDKVVMWHISANRDEEVFDDPFTFDVNRTPNDHIAFGGGGAHYCLGANLAKMELRLIFQEIVDRMPDIHRVGEPEWLRSNFIGGMKHLPVAWTPGRRVNPGSAPKENLSTLV